MDRTRIEEGLAPASSVEIREDLWPLVVIQYGRTTTPDAWERMFDGFAKIQRRHERFFTINDATNASVPSARERAVIGRRSRELEAGTRRFLVGSCVVNPSALIRGAITAINWIAPPPYKLTVVATLNEGYAVAAEQMRAHGLVPHPNHSALAGG